MSAQREIELKLVVAPQDLETLKTVAAPQGVSEAPAAPATLRSTYVDTPDQALRRARISLRLRDKSSGQRVQTLKIGTGVKGGLSSAVEIEKPLEGDSLDVALIDDPRALKALNRAVAGYPLSPVFETRIERHVREIRAGPDVSVEIALDQGDVVAGDLRAPLCEVELERVSGPAAGLFATARWLLADVPFAFSPCSKSERGYRLMAGEQVSPLPRGAGEDLIDREHRTGEAMAAVLADCLMQIADNRLGYLATPEPEIAHQLRVGLRRLRSALDLFRPALEEVAARRHLAGLARNLARLVGPVRDLDVLRDEIVAPLCQTLPEIVSASSLMDLLEQRRSALRQRLADDLRDPRWNDLLLTLAELLALRPWERAEGNVWEQDLEKTARQALKRRWKAVQAYGDRLDDLSETERHDMRKALKGLRYGLDFFGPLYPGKRLKPWLAALKRLQDVFGSLNDVAMAERLASGLDDLPPQGAFAAGFCLARARARADRDWRKARKLWDELAGRDPFWTRD